MGIDAKDAPHSQIVVPEAVQAVVGMEAAGIVNAMRRSDEARAIRETVVNPRASAISMDRSVRSWRF